MGYTPPYLEVRTISGGYKIYPPTNTSTDDLAIYPNGTDSYSYVKLFGNGAVFVAMASGTGLTLYDAATKACTMYYSTPDWIVQTEADKNIFLKTQGTGVVKFGTYTAGAATDSTGYITIKDAGGTERKLMVQA